MAVPRAAFIYLVVVATMLVAGALARTPCNRVLCHCRGTSATCIVKANFDESQYGKDINIRSLVIHAPYNSLCVELKTKFPYVGADYHCIVGSANSKTDVPATFTAATDMRKYTAAVEKATQAPPALSGKLTSFYPSTDITTPTATTNAMSVTDTTSTELTTTTTLINDPKRMVQYKSPEGGLKWCIVRSLTCECNACAKNCPCPTPEPCPTSEPCRSCSPSIIWISPSPPNGTSPATPSTLPTSSTATSTTPTPHPTSDEFTSSTPL